MAYTPELSQHHSATLRRIAWATLDPEKVCSACRDKSRCPTCPFNRKGAHHAQNPQV